MLDAASRETLASFRRKLLGALIASGLLALLSEAPVASFFRIMQGFSLAGGVLAIILGLLHRQPSQGRLLTAWDESLWFALLFLICRAGTRLCAT